MEALPVPELPEGPDWQYEPKWDGFRCLVFREKENVVLQSKAGRPLGRYFPELVESVLAVKAPRFVLDGEIVIQVKNALDFDQLLQRIHPAESRVKKLASEFPARIELFDLLSDERGSPLVERPLVERRQKLEQFAARYLRTNQRLQLSPATKSISEAKKWLDRPGSFLDGIIAKRIDLPYASGERSAMQKFKRIRTADCVVGGFRYLEAAPVVGSLLLGLYEDGLLHHVGYTSSFEERDRTALLKKLKPLIRPPGFTGRAPGGPSRWSTKRTEQWEPLRPRLVAEVAYDHVTGDRFRHGTKFVRWRPDKAPEQCTMTQIRKRRGDEFSK
jgi:ATP-dependent DNA ligase